MGYKRDAIKSMFDSRALSAHQVGRGVPEDVIQVKEGSVEKVPVATNDLVNKAYADSLAGGTPHAIVSATHSDSSGSPVSGQYLKFSGAAWIPAAGGAGVSVHSDLTNLAYANAAHTGFEPAKGADDNFVTDAEKAALHAQNTDTALGSGAVAADHGTAATDQVVNVCYGTGAAPAANTTTEGAVYLTYTA